MDNMRIDNILKVTEGGCSHHSGDMDYIIYAITGRLPSFFLATNLVAQLSYSGDYTSYTDYRLFQFSASGKYSSFGIEEIDTMSEEEKIFIDKAIKEWEIANYKCPHDCVKENQCLRCNENFLEEVNAV